MCVCVSKRRGSVCVWEETQRSGRMWVTTAAAAADCEPANFTSAVLICFFPFVLIFKIFSLFPSAAVFWGFYFIFTAVVVCFSVCVCVGMSNEGIALAALRLSLFSERGSRRGRHCTGDRTACLPLLLPLGWWVTMMWCDLCPTTPPPPCSFPNASPSTLYLCLSLSTPPSPHSFSSSSSTNTTNPHTPVGGNRAVPLLGAALQKPFREYLEAQKAKLHHLTGEGIPAVSTRGLSAQLLFIHVCSLTKSGTHPTFSNLFCSLSLHFVIPFLCLTHFLWWAHLFNLTFYSFKKSLFHNPKLCVHCNL